MLLTMLWTCIQNSATKATKVIETLTNVIVPHAGQDEEQLPVLVGKLDENIDDGDRSVGRELKLQGLIPFFNCRIMILFKFIFERYNPMSL